MKRSIIALILALLLLLTGCAPVNSQNDHLEQQNSQVPQDEQAQQNEKPEYQQNNQTSQNEHAPQNHDLGTTPENITIGSGNYAMANGFVYVTDKEMSNILEYDIESGKIVTLAMPKSEMYFPGKTALQNFRPYGNLFLLGSGIGYIEKKAEMGQQADSTGKMQWYTRSIQTLSILSYDGGKSISIPELGNHVYSVIPMKKAAVSDTDPDNPLAGLELYYYHGHDTFPEMAEQMAQNGFTLEEPTDPNERNKYIVPALGYMDGDTRETKILTKDFSGNFFVDETYVYILRNNTENESLLYRSRRDEIDFQQLDLGGGIGNYIACYDGGFYFWAAGTGWNIRWYKDGEITELPIFGGPFIRWRDQLIYQDRQAQDGTGYYPLKIYDLNTGEIRLLCESTYFRFCVLGDRYVAFQHRTETSKDHVLMDLETGKMVEIHKKEDSSLDRPAEVQQAIEESREEAKAEYEKEQQAQQESTGE